MKDLMTDRLSGGRTIGKNVFHLIIITIYEEVVRLKAKRPNARATERQVDQMLRRPNAKRPKAKANVGQAD